MTDNKSEGIGKDESSSYLYETFVTDDGIEVPPPSRPMGPRRLARYRDDAAAYLRALRDGDALPAESVPYLVLPEEGGEPETNTRAIQQRFNTLAQQGGIDTDTETSDDLFSGGGKDTRDGVVVPDTAAAPLAPPGIGPDTEPATVEQIIGDDPGAPGLTPEEQVVSASDIGMGGDLIFDEDELEGFDRLRGEAAETGDSAEGRLNNDTVGTEETHDFVEDDTEQGIVDTELGLEEGFMGGEFIDGDDEGWEESASHEDPVDSSELPDPVRALDARGLDLERIETSIDDDLDDDSEVLSTGSDFTEGQRDVLQPAADALEGDEEKTPRGKMWFLIFLLLVVLAVVAAWFFFQ